MKTYTQFIAEAPTEAEAAKIAPGISPEKRRAALERNARNQARRDTPTKQKKQKALPAGNQGGDIQKTTTSSIVKPQSKSGGLAKRPSQGITKAKSNKLTNPNIKKVDVKVDKPKFQARRPGTTRTTTTTTTKPDKQDKTSTPVPTSTATTKPKGKNFKDFSGKKRKFKNTALGKVTGAFKSGLGQEQGEDESGTKSVQGLTYKGGGFD